ncbi:MAG: riboflavin synthase [Polyangiaceae bacterium]|nr:riboflavin synthase [Polyangiaceae bacterium]
MFTGLVQALGRLSSRTARGTGLRVVVETDLGAAGEPLIPGESIAVSGACLTVAVVRPEGFAADVSRETCSLTTLGALVAGARVNLERALRLQDRLGGHVVSGHVDGIGRVARVEPDGEAWRVRFAYPEALGPLIAVKGSVAVDGVSLTVNEVDATSFEVTLIPHTRAMTTLGGLEPGAPVNLEADVLARYAARWLAHGREGGDHLEAALRRAGFLETS